MASSQIGSNWISLAHQSKAVPFQHFKHNNLKYYLQKNQQQRWCVFVCVFSHVQCSVTPWNIQHARHLCPWDFPGKNTAVGCHFLLQGILPTQGSNLRLLHLLHWQPDCLSLSHLASPSKSGIKCQFLDGVSYRAGSQKSVIF